MLKKLFTKFLIVAFLINVSIQPARALSVSDGSAIVAGLAFAGAAVATGAAAPLLISLGIHAGVLGIVFNTDPASSAPSNTGSGLVVHLNGSVIPKITPVGWSSPILPPASSLPKTKFRYNSVGVPEPVGGYDTIALACDAFSRDQLNLMPLNYGASLTSSSGTTCYYQIFGGPATYGIPTTTSCSAGYTLSGSSCVLSTPNLVKKPALTPCEFFASGGSFSSDSQNDECAAAMGVDGKSLPNGAKAKITPNSITINRADGSTATVTLNPSGSVTSVEKHPNQSTGQTTTTTTDISAPLNGVSEVTGQSSATSTGIGTQEGASSGNAPQGVDCPSCAKDVTLQQTNSKLDGIASSLNGGTQPTGFGVDPSVSMQQGLDNISAAGNDLPSYSWTPSIFPGNAIACRPIPWSSSVSGGLLNGASGTGYVDICAQLDLVRQVLGYLFMVGAAIYVFRAFFRANDGS